jgi:hypothetical protein|tara:strand:+ start:67 stop:375 length:309 start_codon:yes stop_codon:yes gene_type:complete
MRGGERHSRAVSGAFMNPARKHDLQPALPRTRQLGGTWERMARDHQVRCLVGEIARILGANDSARSAQRGALIRGNTRRADDEANHGLSDQFKSVRRILKLQ